MLELHLNDTGLAFFRGEAVKLCHTVFCLSLGCVLHACSTKIFFKMKKNQPLCREREETETVLTTVFALVASSGIYELLTLAVGVQFADSCFFKLRHEQPP